ncbi:twin-arginine translocase TatA/TatE family subunit [Salinibacterium hongtaonis]|uniref:Sec-independent protein translocase protein TatA n=1 Tax=Homoserinimonas hongtaonis TaxID=2079791 RepID=A0A2U1SYB3_9MICO|nr:twin-arginine translocase TatA/TatE family subunit [Salinibacterium hongtaonis]AWB89148.1 hypothetical protein C2138_06000 [Salinibacterium hongtaonis]PWB96596.1 hypothetical protein DF220_01155 [Salinibacterium hongtaonis]
MPANLGGWTGLLLVLIVLVLFAAPKLPSIAKSVAQSMNIFKSEMSSNKKDAKDEAAAPTDENAPKN